MRSPTERESLGRSFDRAAVEYEAGRPGYPAALVEWWVSMGAFPEGGRVLDLAAGTGKLTRSLVGRRCAVVAVEPLANMRSAFVDVAELAPVLLLDGSAESIPLPDGSVDSVVVGQAFHWFDPVVALPEVARVLRPGGGLGLAWNDDDLDGAPPWVRLVHERKESIGGGSVRLGVDPSVSVVQSSGLFGPIQSAVFRSAHQVTPAQALASLASRSYVIALDEAARVGLLDEIAAAIDAPDDTVLDHPLVTAGFWTRRT